ncbi:SRPBCC family protein [Salipaludibacillus keqinensis]|nr:SRPBCC domain-containing protein [Salipaludibacillus keqinensis]
MNTSTTTLTMTRQFSASADSLFDAWMNPEKMKKWFFTMEQTNQVANNEPHVGGTWEIVDHRDGTDYRAIGEYIEVEPLNKIVLTVKMPQFSDSEDRMTVDFIPLEQGCEMVFTHVIFVPHEEGWTKEDIDKSVQEYHDQTEHGWGLMFDNLKQLVETGKVDGPQE